MPEISPPPPTDAKPGSKRIAFLVIHGMGQQRPYEALDQFTRGLLESFASDKNIAWRIYPQLDIWQDPIHAQQDWVRASYRIAPGAPVAFQSDAHPASETIEDITLFEYYWAPITQEKVTYTGSLLFLIRAGLRPFLYMGANINAIGKTDPGRLWKVVARESVRQVFLFLPLILLVAASLAWLNSLEPLAVLKMLRHPSAPVILTTVLIFIRYLWIYTTGKALFQSLKAKSGWQTSLLWRGVMFVAFLANIIVWPLYLSPILRAIAALGSSIARRVPSLPSHLGHWSYGLRMVAGHTSFPAHCGWLRRIEALLFLDPSFSAYLHIIVWLLLAAFVRFILINYVGDVAVYVTASELARNFAARSQILDECSATLTGILKQKLNPVQPDSPPAFDQVYLAAHSLGSVIAYDTINTLLDRARTASPEPEQIQGADLERLRGMVTFGSPLNKIFYFFREQIDPRQVLRAQTLDLLHGFRVLPNLKQPGGSWQFQPVTDDTWKQAGDYLDKNFRWINAYSIEDPISGRLIFYDLQGELNQKQYDLYPPITAHLSYWKDPKFYAFVRQRLL